MNHGLSLQLSTRAEMLQELRQSLEQRLAQQQSLKIALEQYLEKESQIETLISYAHEHDTWKRFDRDGFNFEYALVPYGVAKPIADEYGCGFAHCHYEPWEAFLLGSSIARSRGEWSLFVVSDKVPERYQPYVAIHERGEELSLGDHFFASHLEFALVSHDKKTRGYVKHLDKTSPGHFVDLTQRVLHPLPDELVAFLTNDNYAKLGELKVAEALIAQHELPLSVLALSENYSQMAKDACDTMQRRIGLMQFQLSNDYERLIFDNKQGYARYTQEDIRNGIEKGLVMQFHEMFEDISNEQIRVTPKGLLQDQYNELLKIVWQGMFEKLRMHLVVEQDFAKAYDNWQNRKPFLSIKTVS